MYLSFNSHKVHHAGYLSDLYPETLPLSFTSDAYVISDELAGNEDNDNGDMQDRDENDALRNQLKHNVASLFLKLQAILYISSMASNEIIEHLNEIYSLSQLLTRETVSDGFQKHGCNVNAVTLDGLVSAVMDCSILFSATPECAELSLFKHRKSLIEHKYPLVMQLQYD